MRRNNPKLNLLLAPQSPLTFKMGRCDLFGKRPPERCRKKMASLRDPNTLFRGLREKNPQMHVYCTSFNRPFYQDKHHRKLGVTRHPLSGFHCTGYGDGSNDTPYFQWNLRFTCSDTMLASPDLGRRIQCSLQLDTSNEDEDARVRYSYEVLQIGKTRRIVENEVFIDTKENN